MEIKVYDIKKQENVKSAEIRILETSFSLFGFLNSIVELVFYEKVTWKYHKNMVY